MDADSTHSKRRLISAKTDPGSSEPKVVVPSTFSGLASYKQLEAGEHPAPKPKPVQKRVAAPRRLRMLDDDGPPLKRVVRRSTSQLPDLRKDLSTRKDAEDAWEKHVSQTCQREVCVHARAWVGQVRPVRLQVRLSQPVREVLRLAAAELGERCSADGLLLVKSCVILPAGLELYRLVCGRVEGKAGPLWGFTEEDEHLVVRKKDYERHKGSFPMSQWEPFRPKGDYSSMIR